jgi:hypothetical protein
MGYKSKLKRINQGRKRSTKILREVIGTDLLTAKEKMIQGECSGLYGLTAEDAYYACPGDPASLSITEFERKLKTIDPGFTIVPCELETESHCLQGHSIYFEVPAYDGFLKVCNVGRNRDYNIPANSQGSIAKFKGSDYNHSGNWDETALLYRGWVAAEEVCKTAYKKWEDDGISPAMVININEVRNLRKAFSLIGTKNQFEQAKLAHEKMLENDRLILTDAVIGDTRKDMFAIDNEEEIEIIDVEDGEELISTEPIPETKEPTGE